MLGLFPIFVIWRKLVWLFIYKSCVDIFLIFLGVLRSYSKYIWSSEWNSQIFSKVVLPFCNPSGNIGESQLLYILANTWHFQGLLFLLFKKFILVILVEILAYFKFAFPLQISTSWSDQWQLWVMITSGREGAGAVFYNHRMTKHVIHGIHRIMIFSEKIISGAVCWGMEASVTMPFLPFPPYPTHRVDCPDFGWEIVIAHIVSQPWSPQSWDFDTRVKELPILLIVTVTLESHCEVFLDCGFQGAETIGKDPKCMSVTLLIKL